MTTVKIYKTMDLGAGSTNYSITFPVGKIEETLKKDLIKYPYPKVADDWGVPTATSPIKYSIDMLNIERVFTVTGVIDALSTDSIYDGSTNSNRTPVSAPEVRDMLVIMMRYGGPFYFCYGLPSDTTGESGDGYKETANNVYYTSTGFECHFNRIQLSEQGQKGAYRAGDKIKYDYLVSDGTEDFSDSDGTGNPKYGTYFLPSEYEVTLELVNISDRS